MATDFAELTSTLRKTRGEIPPPLVGSSVTLVGDSILVFGGRPVESRTMVSTLYSLDLRTLIWTKVNTTAPSPASSTSAIPLSQPSPRYFHSAEAWGHRLVVFGGQSYVIDEESQEGGGGGHLETLDELWIFDTLEQTWSSPLPTVRPGTQAPLPRYAHLAVVASVSSEPPVPGFEDSAPPPSTSSRLVVIGGQDYQNNYLSEMSVLDLDKMEWIAQAPYPRKAGSYRSVASASQTSLAPLETKSGADGYSVYSSHSFPSTEDSPEPIFVFTNSNFANPRRDLDLVPSPLDSFTTPSYLSVADRMGGTSSLPPGIRFPRLYSCGSRHLVFSGASVEVDQAECVIWALDLGERGGSGALKTDERFIWKKLSVEKLLGNGSWGSAVGWRNTLVVLGDKERDMMSDYNLRQNNFSSVVFVDLESFGIYEPPPQPLPPTAQTLGLLTLSQPRLFDFEIICSDRERLGCCRSILESRWPWFANEIKSVSSRSTPLEASEANRGGGGDDYDREEMSDEEPIDVLQRASSPLSRRPSVSVSRTLAPPTTSSSSSRRLFPISSHALELPLPSPEVKALLQYFHTLALSTPLQRSIPILSSLLSFDKTYSILPNLRALVVHALHESLQADPGSAAKIYEAAAVGRSMALQICAMQVMVGRSAGIESPLNRSRENSFVFVDVGDRMLQRQSGSSHPSTGSRYSSHSDQDSEHRFPRSPSVSPQIRQPPTFVTQPLPPPPPPSGSLPLLPPSSAAPFPHHQRTPRTDSASTMNGLPGSTSMNFPHPPSRPVVSPVPSLSPPAPLPPTPSPPVIAANAATPARIAEAWREGEERDRRQRAEQARLEAESGFARLRLGQRNGSIATMSSGSSSNPGDPSRRPSTTPSSIEPSSNHNSEATPFSILPTGSVANYYRDSDTTCCRTTSSGGDSGYTQTSSEKAVKGAATVGKVIKKGLFAGLMSQPEFHQSGTAAAPVATGPPVRKVYPAPRPKYPQKEKKANK
ncbi:uncharacterized protein JCM6883_000225 [Sporobolomyces salmoneus]|uniref:uncharacterized protein n=1 Tax=Sporobolomyces salmoneus TaxID=183962 RepID=UPI0031714993